MSFTFDATEGGPNSNSFCTVQFADDYFGGSLYSLEWPATSAGADLLNKQKALVSACRMLDRQTWLGTSVYLSSQRLQFPRAGLVDRNGFYIPSATIPMEIKEAQCELALFILQSDPTQVVDQSLRQFRHLKIANVLELEMTDALPSETDLPARVLELVGRFMQTPGAVRVLRA